MSLTSYSPFLTQQRPGVQDDSLALLLDRNLLAIKKALDDATFTLNKLTTVVNINVTSTTPTPSTPIQVPANSPLVDLGGQDEDRDAWTMPGPPGARGATGPQGIPGPPEMESREDDAPMFFPQPSPIVWPTAGQVVFSTGIGPAGDSHLTYDSTFHELQVQPGGDLAIFNLFNTGGANFEGVIAAR